MSGETGQSATKSRILNRLAFDMANKATSLAVGVATGDQIPIADVSADYQMKSGSPFDLRLAAAGSTIVTTTATAVTLTLTQHGERILLINTNSTVANAFTLPAATGSGARYKLVNNIAQTQGSIVINTASVFAGKAMIFASTQSGAEVFKTASTTNTITMNRTTTGGIGYDSVDAIDVASGVYFVDVLLNGSGTLATPFTAV